MRKAGTQKAKQAEEEKHEEEEFEKSFLKYVQSYSTCAIMGPSETKEDLAMRGYYTAGGFFGLVDGKYLLFSDESEYYDYMED